MSYQFKDFTRDVLQRSHQVPVLVDFWADWCGPCKMLAPVLERLAAQAGGRWVLVKVNTDEHPDLATEYEIASIPNVKLFREGKVVDEFMGMMPEGDVRRWLEAALPSPHAASVAEAQRLVAAGSLAQAARLLEPVVAAEPSHEQARVLLAQCLLGPAPERVESVLADIGSDSELAERAAGLRTLARVAASAAQPDTLPEAPVRARFLAGAQAVRSGDYPAALEAFIEVIQRRSDYHDGAARQACRAIFQMLGPRHPISERYHRAFSSAVNV